MPVRSVDAAFSRVLQLRPFRGHVHSVFDRVVNLQHIDGELFSLAGREIDNAPQTAIVATPGFDGAGIQAGDSVIGIGTELQVGDGVVVQWAAAAIWQARLPRYAGAGGCLPEQLLAARARLGGFGGFGGLDGEDLRNEASRSFPHAVGAALAQRSSALLDALAQQRHADACRHALSMVGLGPGLTPSGDDFLVGLFAVLNLAGSPCCGWLDGGRQVLPQAGQATNAISLAALRAAAEGRVRESISALIDALMHGTPASLDATLRRVLAIGATSGADIAAGIVAGLELNLQAEARTRSLVTTVFSTGA